MRLCFKRGDESVPTSPNNGWVKAPLRRKPHGFAPGPRPQFSRPRGYRWRTVACRGGPVAQNRLVNGGLKQRASVTSTDAASACRTDCIFHQVANATATPRSVGSKLPDIGCWRRKSKLSRAPKVGTFPDTFQASVMTFAARLERLSPDKTGILSGQG